MPADLRWAMVSRAVQLGNFSFAALLGLGCDCSLRTGELLAIRPVDLLLRGNKGIVTLPSSKRGTRHNVRESATILHQQLFVLLSELVKLKRELRLMQTPIWTGSGTSFRKALQKMTKFFKFEHLGFRGYSLRRGGATV